MATFPALRPSTRSFTAATYPGVVHTAYSGKESRVRTSNASTGARLRLQFPGVSESEMLEIASHYAGQRGRFLPFQLSDEVLDGMTNPAVLRPTGYLWIYTSSPKVTDISIGTPAAPSCVHDIELELELVPEVSQFVNGAKWVAVATMTGGAADNGNLNLPGASWSAAAFIYGANDIYDGSASGASWNTTASITESLVSYGADATGAAWTAAVAIDGGGIVTNGSAMGTTWSAAATISGGAGTGGAATNPSFSSVSLLLHMEGSNGSTTFIDSSANGLSITVFGNAQISTAQSKFGGASGLFDGTGDYLLAPASGSAIGTGDFTIEGWLFMPSSGSGYQSIVGLVPSSDNQSLYRFNNTLAWYAGGRWASSATLATSTWHHFAATRSAGTLRLFVNGIQTGTSYAENANIANNVIRIGANGATNSEWLNGYIDDLRITKGVARYTSNFTPPTAAFPDS